jgi:hypothetical protein
MRQSGECKAYNERTATSRDVSHRHRTMTGAPFFEIIALTAGAAIPAAQRILGGGDVSDQWFYVEGDERKGPVSLGKLVDLLNRTTEPENTFVWKEGLTKWVEAGSMAQLSPLLIRPPPLPVRTVTDRTTSDSRNTNWKGRTASMVGLLIGLVVAKLLGSAFWVPALLIWISFWLLNRSQLSSPVVLMLCVLLGQTFWLIVGNIALAVTDKPSNYLGSLPFELATVAMLTWWCTAKQSAVSCLAVLAYQICAAIVIVKTLEEIVAPLTAAGPLIQLTLRLVGCGLAVYAAVKMWQRSQLSRVQLKRDQ